MAFTDSERKQVQGVIPPVSEVPTVPAHLQQLLDGFESRLVLRAQDWAWADAFVAPYEDGMLLHVQDVNELLFRVSGGWVKLYPTTYTGTAEPSPDLGADGDLYFLTEP